MTGDHKLGEPTEPQQTSTALEASIGSKTGASFRLKGAMLADSSKVGTRRTGTVPAGWTRIAVLAGGKAGTGARYWELVPADEPSLVPVAFEGFYVRGAFKVAARTNNERQARERFADFKGEP